MVIYERMLLQSDVWPQLHPFHKDIDVELDANPDSTYASSNKNGVSRHPPNNSAASPSKQQCTRHRVENIPSHVGPSDRYHVLKTQQNRSHLPMQLFLHVKISDVSTVIEYLAQLLCMETTQHVIFHRILYRIVTLYPGNWKKGTSIAPMKMACLMSDTLTEHSDGKSKCHLLVQHA